MGKLINYKNDIVCSECGLILQKKNLPCYRMKDFPDTHMVNFCMRCGTEFESIIDQKSYVNYSESEDK